MFASATAVMIVVYTIWYVSPDDADVNPRLASLAVSLSCIGFAIAATGFVLLAINYAQAKDRVLDQIAGEEAEKAKAEAAADGRADVSRQR
jgi:hypothetical protein